MLVGVWVWGGERLVDRPINRSVNQSIQGWMNDPNDSQIQQQSDRLAAEVGEWRGRAQALHGEKAALETATDSLEGRVRALEAAEAALRWVELGLEWLACPMDWVGWW